MPGLVGAEKLATAMIAYVEDVRVIRPPSGTKDVREWKQAGLTHDLLEAEIGATKYWSLNIRIRKGGQNV